MTSFAAYNEARAIVLSQHTYTVSDRWASCACGEQDDVGVIGNHILREAEIAGQAARRAAETEEQQS